MSKFNLCLFAALTLFSVNSYADTKADLKQVAVDYQNALAKLDVKAFTATTTENSTIIDEMEPFTWTGKNASTQFINDFRSMMSKDKLSNMVVEVKDAVKVLEGKNEIYAVFPVAVSYKSSGMKVNHEVAYQTIIFDKSKNGKWLIKSSTWTSIKGE
ncbi:hypothetical protein SAMN06295945_1066 [Polynucleobacter meluiroseus]|uniref:SnoaL-like domain-containing protein n=1 Tax=Polynucleobacter meluiroseus TaxID=1938814 RepID=A0A240E2J6_9BURK|nr:hypothetical protein [Polynucleobacter meluiroseus]SNX28721.1 hypothetical protein SAMN06295945_1066 [Polynucleobacter meluiroseus]